jgi:hypothetical protein
VPNSLDFIISTAYNTYVGTPGLRPAVEGRCTSSRAFLSPTSRSIPLKTAAQMAASYQQAMANPQTAANFTAGVQAVTQSPAAAAATPQAEQLYIQGVQQSVTSGKRAAALQAVTLQQWQQATTQKGAARLASGAQAAQSKVQAFFTKQAPVYAAMKAAVSNMPKGGLVNAVARVQAALQVEMAAAGRSS